MSVSKVSKALYSLPGLAALFAPGMALAEYELNMTQGVTSLSGTIYDLHMLIFWIVTLIGIVVFGIMFYSIYAHRKSKGAVPAKFHENTSIEIIWTIIPSLILVGVAIPATKTLLEYEDASGSDLTIQATAYQWKWKYDYHNYHDQDLSFISFFSNLDAKSNEARQLDSGIDPATVENYLLDVDNAVVVPVNKKIRLLTTSADVIHAWWVPELAVKRDAVPGYINESWMYIEKAGVYRGQCAELCGKDHGFMPIVVIAMAENEFDAWVSEQQAAKEAETASAAKAWTKDELFAKGEEKYNTFCASCHLPNGEGTGPFPPLKGSAIVKGPAQAHLELVMNGKGAMMPAFAAQLSDVDIAAILTYERNAWGNDTGDMVQPSDVKAAR